MCVYAVIFLILSILRLGGCSVGVFFSPFESLGRIFFLFFFVRRLFYKVTEFINM